MESEPIGESRYNAKDEDMENQFIELKNSVDGVPALLIYKMDEAFQDEYVDEHSMKVIVKSDFKGEITNIPVRRELKRATLIHFICVDGLILKRITYSNLYIKN